jgi:hypothetical protein
MSYLKDTQLCKVEKIFQRQAEQKHLLLPEGALEADVGFSEVTPPSSYPTPILQVFIIENAHRKNMSQGG